MQPNKTLKWVWIATEASTGKLLDNTAFPNNSFHWKTKTMWPQMSWNPTDKHAAVMTHVPLVGRWITEGWQRNSWERFENEMPNAVTRVNDIAISLGGEIGQTRVGIPEFLRPNCLNLAVFRSDWPQWPVAYEAGEGGPPSRLEKFKANSVFRTSLSCWKIMKDKKYFNTVKNFMANSVFQGKRRLFKILNDKKYILNTVNSGHTLFSRQTQVVQKYWM